VRRAWGPCEGNEGWLSVKQDLERHESEWNRQTWWKQLVREESVELNVTKSKPVEKNSSIFVSFSPTQTLFCWRFRRLPSFYLIANKQTLLEFPLKTGLFWDEMMLWFKVEKLKDNSSGGLTFCLFGIGEKPWNGSPANDYGKFCFGVCPNGSPNQKGHQDVYIRFNIILWLLLQFIQPW